MDEAKRTEAFNTYARARAVMSFAQVFGFRPEWPDRPADLPADFDELHLTALAQALVSAFGEPEGWRPESDGAEPDSNEWGWVSAADDGRALLEYLDQHIAGMMREAKKAVDSLTARGEAP